VRFAADRKDLLDGVTAALECIDQKAVTPSMGMVLLQSTASGLIITGSDLYRLRQTAIPAEVREPGSLALAPQVLRDLLRRFKVPSLEFISVGESAEIQGGKSKYTVSGLNPAEYPRIHIPEDGEWTSVPSLTLGDLLDRVTPSMDNNDSDPNRVSRSSLLIDAQSGLDADETCAYACDGARLAIAAMPHDLGVGRVMIPRTGIMSLRKFLEPLGTVAITLARDWLYLRYGGRILGVRTLDGSKFLNVRSVLPVGTPEVAVLPRALLQETLERLAVVSGDGAIRLSLGSNLARLAAVNGAGEETIEVQYSGKPYDLGLHPEKTIPVIAGFVCDRIRLEIFAVSEPIVIKPDNDDPYLASFMPVRLE